MRNHDAVLISGRNFDSSIAIRYYSFVLLSSLPLEMSVRQSMSLGHYLSFSHI